MLSLIAGFLGGMGLFFAGLKLTGEDVRRLAGRRSRARFLRWTQNRPLAGLTGFFLGVLFQSTSGLSLLLASLVGVGATSVAGALPVLVAASAGVASLVIMAVVDIRVLIFALVGLSGLILAFERPAECVAPVQSAQDLLCAAIEALREVVENVAALRDSPFMGRLGLAGMEGTDLLLLTAADAFSQNGDDDALDQLLELCHDR